MAGRDYDAPLRPAAPDPGTTGTRRRTRPVVVVVSAVLLVAAVAVTAALVLPRLSGDSTAVPAPTGPETSSDAATGPTGEPAGASPPTVDPTSPADEPPATLLQLAVAGAGALTAIPDGTWVPQVSAKCTPLTTVDLQDSSGRVGWPDGTREDYPAGITEQGIMDFHTGMAARLGLAPSGLILVTPDALGMTDRAASICGNETLWISLVETEQHATRRGALDYCATSGLPQGECAARRIGPDTKFVLPAGDPPRPDDPNTYPVTTATTLAVRSSPALDAPVLGYVPANGYVTIQCVLDGDPVQNTRGDPTSLWDHISRPIAGYVSQAFVDTRGENPPQC